MLLKVTAEWLLVPRRFDSCSVNLLHAAMMCVHLTVQVLSLISRWKRQRAGGKPHSLMNRHGLLKSACFWNSWCWLRCANKNERKQDRQFACYLKRAVEHLIMTKKIYICVNVVPVSKDHAFWNWMAWCRRKVTKIHKNLFLTFIYTDKISGTLVQEWGRFAWRGKK